MKKGDTIYIDLEVGKKKEIRSCRAVIQEVHGPVCRLEVWDGKRIFSENAMTKDLRREP